MTTTLHKPHREFFRVFLTQVDQSDSPWVTLPGSNGLIEELILSDNMDHQAKSGSRTTLARWHAGALLPKPVIHDFHEEVFIVEGSLVVGCDPHGQGGETFEAYTFACRPPEISHGPFFTSSGCVMLEFQYY